MKRNLFIKFIDQIQGYDLELHAYGHFSPQTAFAFEPSFCKVCPWFPLSGCNKALRGK